MTTPRWAALPEREPGEVLRDINFRTDDGRIMAQFRHRDNRIWSAVISPLTDINFRNYDYTIQLSSGGCRTYRFVARVVNTAKGVVQRFANMPLELYERMVADAQPTTDHPRSDDIGVFRMQVVKQRRAGPGGYRTETQRYMISGLGRVDGNSITIFPNSEEIGEILLTVCPQGAQPLVPQGINELDRNRFNRSALDTTDVPDLEEDEVAEAISRSFNDDLETALAGLDNGSYEAPRPRAREERALDIFGEDDD